MHAYGSTEANLIAQCVLRGRLLPDGDPVPVGAIVAGKRVQIVDEQGRAVEAGVEGEIVVMSDHLSPGYWRDSELTDESFGPGERDGERRFRTGDLGWMRADGMLELLGRKDAVLKIRGYRVDLGEVEQRLSKLNGVRQAAAVPYEQRAGVDAIAAFVSLVPGSDLSTRSARIALEASLPSYMVPSRFIFMDSLPLTPNGKVDRRRLPRPGAVRPAAGAVFRAARGEDEKLACRIWSELLDVEEIGLDDDFFDLGGDSLSATAMLTRVERELGREVDAAFFDTPTVAGMLARSSGRSRNADGAGVHRSARRLWNLLHTALGGLQWARSLTDGGPLLRRLAGLSPAVAAMMMPYALGSRFLAYWCRGERLMARLYRMQFQSFKELLEDLDLPADQAISLFGGSVLGHLMSLALFHRRLVLSGPGDTMLESLSASPFPFRRSVGLAIASNQTRFIDRHFRYTGLPHIEDALARGRGLVLLSFHAPGLALSARVLSKLLGDRPVLLLSRHEALRRSRPDVGRAVEAGAAAARETREAVRRLTAGGIVQVVLESSANRTALACGAGRRLYHFEPGFAELAQTTGAAVIPWHTWYDSTGRINSRFLPPLPMAGHGDREAVFAALLRAWAAQLEAIWREYPQGIDWRDINIHCRLPASPANSGAT